MNSRPPPDQLHALSRRRLIALALAGGEIAASGVLALEVAAGVGALLAPDRAVAAQKLGQAEIGYQPSPRGAQRCDQCVNWLGGNTCKVVAGVVSPSGWCGLFMPRR